MANAQDPFPWTSVYNQGVTSTFSDAQTAEPIVKFTTRTNMGYHVEAKVVAITTDAYDEVNGYTLTGVFKNDGGTLTQVGSTDDDVGIESNAGWDVDFAVDGTDIQVVFTSDASPITVRTKLEIIEVGSKAPHFYGDSTNA